MIDPEMSPQQSHRPQSVSYVLSNPTKDNRHDDQKRLLDCFICDFNNSVTVLCGHGALESYDPIQ